MDQANKLYQSGEFDAASQQYMGIAKSGVISETLFYNIGNCNAKLNKNGEAVLWYERARTLSPRDHDLLLNLKKIAPASEPTLMTRVRDTALNSISTDESLLLSSILLIIVGLLMLSMQVKTFSLVTSKSYFRALAFVIAFITVISATLSVYKIWESQKTYAIVMQHNAILRTGPGNNFSEIIRLAEGEKIELLPFSDPKWCHIKTANGQNGFIALDAAKTIFPISF